MAESAADLPNRIANYTVGTIAVMRAGGSGEADMPNCNGRFDIASWLGLQTRSHD